MRSYKALWVVRRLSELPGEDRDAVISLLKKVKHLNKLVAGGYVEVARGLAEMQGLTYFYNALFYYRGREDAARFGLRACDGGGCGGEGAAVDLSAGELRLWTPWHVVTVKLNEGEVKYIRQRLEEGAEPAYAEAWADNSRLYVALKFVREVEPIRPKKLVVVVVDAARHRAVVGVVDRYVEEVKAFEAPAEKVRRALKRAQTYAQAPKLRNAKKKRKRYEKRAENLVRDFVEKASGEIAELARRHEAEVWIHASVDSSAYGQMDEWERVLARGLLELARRVRRKAAWHGVLARYVDLPASKCPRCGAEVRDVEGVAFCGSCGFISEADRVPLYWALKKWIGERAKA